jgi:phospholipase/carboxylesterase
VPTENEFILQLDHNWVIRTRLPETTAPDQVVVFLHGWTGDEHSMEVFSRGLPHTYLLLFPRGPIQAPTGFGWTQSRQGALPEAKSFFAACRALMPEIEPHLTQFGVTGAPIRLVGFSQGGAAACMLTQLYPERIERVAVLAGYLPQPVDPTTMKSLRDKPFYVAHGTRDETIPVDVARRSVAALQFFGADVDYCESDTGHKLAAACFQKLARFLTEQTSGPG